MHTTVGGWEENCGKSGAYLLPVLWRMKGTITLISLKVLFQDSTYRCFADVALCRPHLACPTAPLNLLNMVLLTLVMQYFSETTVHGFRYVSTDVSRTKAERVAWVTAIAAAITVSAVLVYKSIHEAYTNPIATTTEMVPITEVVLFSFTHVKTLIDNPRRNCHCTLLFIYTRISQQ